MQYSKFIKLTERPQPPAKLSGIHLAIWYILKDDWNMAHKTVQDLNTENACWIHAYLHRLEGDLGNANYWYRQVYKDLTTQSLELELNDIIRSVFS